MTFWRVYLAVQSKAHTDFLHVRI